MHLATLSAVKLPNHSIKLMAIMLDELGADVEQALQQVGLTASDIEDPAALVTGLQEVEFQRAFMQQTPDQPEVWVDLGSRYRLLTHAHTDYGLLMSTAPTVDAAIKIGFNYGDLYYMLADAEGIFAEDGRQIGFRSLPVELPRDMRRFSALRDVGVNCTVFSELWGEPFPFDTVELPVPARDEPFVRRFLPDADLHFDSEFNRWRWSVRLDQRRPPHSDPVLHDYYRSACDRLLAAAHREGDLVDRVLTLLDESKGQDSVDYAARKLALSTRSLQRKLGDRGFSYRELAALARHRHACRLLLTTRHPVSRVALDTGYDNVSAFNNAFRRLSGVTPSQYRNGMAIA